MSVRPTERGAINQKSEREGDVQLEQDEMFLTNLKSVASTEESVQVEELPFEAPEAALESRSLSSEEIRLREDKKKKELEHEFREELMRLENAAGLFMVPDWLRSFVGTALGFIVIVILLLVSAQVLSGFGIILSLPAPLSWSLGVFYGATVAISIVLLFRCVWLFGRNRRSVLTALGHTKELRKRKRLQQIASKHTKLAIDELSEYLREYEFDGRRRTSLIAWGMTESEIERLIAARAQLLDLNGNCDFDQWIEKFQREFQGRLDDIARRVVKKTAIRAGVITAASPDAFFDRLVLLGLTLGMYMQLLEIYKMRPTTGAALNLLGASFSHAYLANSIQTVSDAIGEEISAQVVTISGSVFASFAGRLTAKGSEGLLNAFLVRRFGNAAISQISPSYIAP